MLLRPAVESDIPQIVALERLPESRKYVGQWSEERHLLTLRGADARYFVHETSAGVLGTYVILRGFDETSGSIELKRIVVGAPEQGLGRRILREVMRMVFEEFGAHRLFLDVFDDNPRARHLYESCGFVVEGTMRESALRDGEYHSMYLMSILDREYRGLLSRPENGIFDNRF